MEEGEKSTQRAPRKRDREHRGDHAEGAENAEAAEAGEKARVMLENFPGLQHFCRIAERCYNRVEKRQRTARLN
jgi:hypothetical protein